MDSLIHKSTSLPVEIRAAVAAYLTCEFSTLARDGTPITWPTTAVYRPMEGVFLIATSPGFPTKALNVRRDPKVALLFSDPTGSGLVDPPAILIQGEAESPNEVHPSMAYPDLVRKVFERKRITPREVTNPIANYLLDWYYYRIPIFITPRRILHWRSGDFSLPPKSLEF